MGQLACEKAALILEHTHDSATALLKAFDLVRSRKGSGEGKGPVGMTTDEEQDILRAMLVMGAAGLDSMAKQLIRDCLPLLVFVDPLAHEGLERFLAQRVEGDLESSTAGRAPRFLARLLASPNLQAGATEQYVAHLTSASLQSAEELRRIAAAFGLTTEQLTTDFASLKSIFDVRNKIIHELDVNLDAPRRSRNIRRKPQLVTETNRLLQAGEELLRAVGGQLQRHGVGIQ
jgi:hypothetical protein